MGGGKSSSEPREPLMKLSEPLRFDTALGIDEDDKAFCGAGRKVESGTSEAEDEAVILGLGNPFIVTTFEGMASAETVPLTEEIASEFVETMEMTKRSPPWLLLRFALSLA